MTRDLKTWVASPVIDTKNVYPPVLTGWSEIAGVPPQEGSSAEKPASEYYLTTQVQTDPTYISLQLHSEMGGEWGNEGIIFLYW